MKEVFLQFYLAKTFKKILKFFILCFLKLRQRFPIVFFQGVSSVSNLVNHCFHPFINNAKLSQPPFLSHRNPTLENPNAALVSSDPSNQFFPALRPPKPLEKCDYDPYTKSSNRPLIYLQRPYC